MEETFLIIGLGNPGSEYAQTRHNVGFMLLDYLKESLEVNGDFREEAKFQSEILLSEYLGKKIIFAKPTTFMNRSGSAVAKLMSYYKIESQNIIVAFDDLDIELGKSKIQNEKSPRQHNGHNSITSTIGNTNFNRIRIGIENRGDQRHLISGHDYVLSKFKSSEVKILQEEVFPSIKNSLEGIIK